VAVEELPGPYEILDMLSGQSIFIKPIRFEWGTIVIRPRWPGAPAEKRVLALRLHVDPATKRFFPYYFDLTSRRLTSGLGPIIERVVREGKWLRITKWGTAPKAWFEWMVVEALPPGVEPSTPLTL